MEGLLTALMTMWRASTSTIQQSVEIISHPETYFACLKQLIIFQVREAIHVAPVTKIGGWRICTNKIDYHRSTTSLLPIYPTLINTYRTLIYNGDVDGCVPFNGNEVSDCLP